jgi:hypothetical protein
MMEEVKTYPPNFTKWQKIVIDKVRKRYSL